MSSQDLLLTDSEMDQLMSELASDPDFATDLSDYLRDDNSKLRITQVSKTFIIIF